MFMSKKKDIKIKEGITLLLSSSQNYFENNARIISELIKEKYEIIYVTSNKPFMILNKFFEKKKQNKNIFFIDMITKTANSTPKKEKNVLFTSSPTSLTEVSIVIDQLIHKLKNKKVLFFDSFTTLKIYNKKESIEKFAHFLSNKLRLFGVKGIFLSIEQEADKELIEKLAMIADNIIKLK